MVRILANGEIVQDNDPRANPSSNRSRIGRINTPQDGAGDQAQGGTMGGVYADGNQGPTVFDTWNGKLLELGIPRWNVGSHVVEPIMTVAMLIVLVMFGLPGIVFLTLLYFVVKMSQGRPSVTSNRRQSPPSGTSSGGNRLGR